MALSRKEISKRYREKHREKTLLENRAYAAKNRDEIRAKAKAKRDANPEEARAYERAWYAANPALVKAKTRRAALAKYGLTPAAYEAKLIEQGGVCAVCRRADKSGKRLAVDHHHDTGRVRGLLCSNCNPGIGYFEESPELMRLAIDYLLAHRSHS